MTFVDLFRSATGGSTPYAYQQRLALEERCESRLISIPTGLGKTAAVVLAWLWNRVILQRQDWPRRLVYCLPMRTLVEQTTNEVTKWMAAILSAHDRGELTLEKESEGALRWLASNSPVILMGGENSGDWDIYPEKDAILIGTQDMLLSRALNRGYGMSRFRWPMHFGLLNNDCLWVLDETQLMGSGLWTSAQLDWMRGQRFKPLFPAKTWWMSATLSWTFLQTSDRQRDGTQEPAVLRLSSEEMDDLPILKARRPVTMLQFKGKEKQDSDAALQKVAQHVAAQHVPATLSMIVCNQVAYAQALHAMIEADPPESRPPVVLLHSRFRPADRKDALDAVSAFEAARKAGNDHPGLVLVSTQVIEAGFDVSSARLWTQIAPWASLIQRLGRLNRDASSNDDAHMYVFELPGDKKDPLPYEKSDIDSTRTIVAELEKLCVAEPDRPIHELLAKLATGPFGEMVAKMLEPRPEPYPRSIDVHGLFSTEPDAFGGFTDVSPWVRNAKANADVTVFWRKLEDNKMGTNLREVEGPPFTREEGCPVAVFRLKNFLGASRHAYQWDPKAQRWESIAPHDVRPGMTLLLPENTGGYEKTRGWTGNKGGDLGELPHVGPFSQRDEEDRESEIEKGWVTLETHLSDAEKFASGISDALGLEVNDELRHCIVRAASLHDIGKSLDHWQRELLKLHQAQDGEMSKTLWAKAPTTKTLFRPGLRHEAASALAMWWLYYRENAADFPALAIYLVAAHHGKVRTVPSTRPTESRPNVCGIPKPAGAGEGFPSAPLPFPPGWRMDFSAADGGASGTFNDDGSFTFEAPGWSGLVADLLGGWEANAPSRTCSAVPETEPGALGPFALAYLEALLRAADGQASNQPSETLTPNA